MSVATMVLIEEKEQGSAKEPYHTTAAVIGGDVRLGCTCMGWTQYKNRTRYCKHTIKLVAKHKLVIEARGDYQYVTNLDTSGNRIAGTVKKSAVTVKVAGDIVHGKAKAPAAPKAAPAAPKPTAMAYGIKIIDVDDSIPALDPYVEPMLADKMPGLADYKIPTVLKELAKYDASKYACEEKYDGERVTLARFVGGALKAWSRPQRDNDGALTREVPPHIAKVFDALPDSVTFTIDGEEYIPGGYSSDVANLANAGKTVFVVFDITRVLGEDTTKETWTDRRDFLEELFSRDAFSAPDCPVQLAKTFDAPYDEAVKSIWARKGEGAILKRRAARYRPGARSTDFIKVKGLETALMTVTGYKKGKLGPYATVMLSNPIDGSATTAKTLDNAARAAFAKNPESFIGRKLWIEYQFRTPDGGYRHPMWDRWENE